MIFFINHKRLKIKVIRQKQFAGNIIWNLLGSILSKGSIFLVSILTARMLSQEDFGRVSYIYQTIALIVIFASMGLSVTAIRFTAEALSSGRDSLYSVVKKLTVLVLIFSFFSILIGLFYQNELLTLLQMNEEQTFVIWLILPIVILTAFNQVQFGILSGVKSFKSLAVSNALVGISSLPIAYILISQFLIKGYLISLLITALLTTICNRIFILKAINKVSVNIAESKINSSYKDIVNFAWPNLFSSLIFTGATWLCFSLLATKNLIEVAAFNVSNQLMGILFIIPTICAQVLMSYTANSKNRQLFKQALFFNGGVSLVLALMMMLSSHYLLGLYGEQYQTHTLVLNLCLATLVVMSLSSQVEHYMVGLGMARSHLVYTLVFSVIFVLLSYSLLDYGAVGIAFSRLIAYLIKLLFSFWYVSKVDYASTN